MSSTHLIASRAWSRRRFAAATLVLPGLVLPPHVHALSGWIGNTKGLVEHHRLLAQLLDQMLLEDDWPRALATAQRLRYVVNAHLLAEEHALYPAADRHGLLHRPDQLFGDHAQQKLDAARLEFSIASQDWRGARRICRSLRDEVVAHSAEEEGGLYRQLLERAPDTDGAPAMIAQYRRAFASVRPERSAWVP